MIRDPINKRTTSQRTGKNVMKRNPQTISSQIKLERREKKEREGKARPLLSRRQGLVLREGKVLSLVVQRQRGELVRLEPHSRSHAAELHGVHPHKAHFALELGRHGAGHALRRVVRRVAEEPRHRQLTLEVHISHLSARCGTIR